MAYLEECQWESLKTFPFHSPKNMDDIIIRIFMYNTYFNSFPSGETEKESILIFNLCTCEESSVVLR